MKINIFTESRQIRFFARRASRENHSLATRDLPNHETVLKYSNVDDSLLKTNSTIV